MLVSPSPLTIALRTAEERMSFKETTGPKAKPKQLLTQQSTVWTRKQNAVCVRRARKTYGPKSNQHIILDNLSMTVPKGVIYGLLGASGCGKTTLLSCIVGRRRLNSGEIWVLGGRPGSRGSGVPGPRIGYMPQELALYGEFTILETMMYFGWIAGMKTKDIEIKTDFLLNLLQLPDRDRTVKTLSGGQQRRVSMAATFLHEPELLILDEPTVGVDPVLRQSVWDYLVELTTLKGTTIIITTHYIDETKQATTIGLMRGGRFLAEESPAELLQRYHSDSLEDAFLKLSIVQNRFKRRRSSIISDVVAANAHAIPELRDTNIAIVSDACDNQSEISGEFGDNMSLANVNVPVIHPIVVDPIPPDDDVAFSWKDVLSLYKSHHMKALVWKNLLWVWRNVGVMCFIFGMPMLQIITFCLSIGKDPVGLSLAVVNNEFPGETLCSFNTSCVIEGFSCRFLHHLSNREYKLIPFENVSDANYAVKKGWAWASISIPPHFSQMVWDKVDQGKDANDTVLDGSEIDVRVDMSNQQIAILLNRDLLLSMRDFALDVASSCDVQMKLIESPVKFNYPIYGDVIPNFTDFAAPGVMLTIVFFLAVALTSVTMLLERNEGMFERCLVSGITGLEILSSHFITQFLIMFCQSAIVILFSIYVFDIKNNGSLFWVSLLILLCGTCGMCYGFVVSCVCDNERSATYVALGSFLPFVELCGIVWPAEGMHYALRKISLILPLTLSTESLRSMLSRGWDISRPSVYKGYISTSIWILFLMIVSILLIKFKKG
ncbi:ABC transporter G family member 23 isoform X1 [Cimex lectularius]|uniref:ABC Transporter n=2 Tax=Cimex lectularius TaxID=79782 RepID=A0A8I6SFY9_CIMLE|nr:ABC transporter G family member 23 isoform X1 [Cimex lectularius]